MYYASHTLEMACICQTDNGIKALKEAVEVGEVSEACTNKIYQFVIPCASATKNVVFLMLSIGGVFDHHNHHMSISTSQEVNRFYKDFTHWLLSQ